MNSRELFYLDGRFNEILSLRKPMPPRIGSNGAKKDEISLENAVRESLDFVLGACEVENSQLGKTMFWDAMKARIGQIPSTELAAHTRDDLILFDDDNKTFGLNLFIQL